MSTEKRAGAPEPQSCRDAYLSRDEIEARYGISRRWLELAAHRGDGPPMTKLSRRMVRYRQSTFEAWLASCEVRA